MMDAAARRFRALVGWRRWAVSALLGALAVLALPPVYALPVLVVSFTGLVWLLDGIDGGRGGLRNALAVGWWFGFAHFAGGLYWITNALFVDAARHGWLAPFAVSGLSVYFAIFPALACAAAVRARPGPQRVLVLAVAWAAAEWLRGTMLTGFPWNPVASALAFHPAGLQSLALFGAYGLGLVVVALAAAPATLAAAGPDQPRSPGFALGALIVAIAIGAGGSVRLALAPGAGATDVDVRVVQASIDQRLKWRADLVREHFETYVRLSRARTAGADADVVIWPETAFPFTFDGDERLVRALRRAVPPGGALVTGAVRTAPAENGSRQLWNAVLAVSSQGIAVYDKHHLVPFGEYVPARGVLPVTKITEGRIDFSAGAGPRTLQAAGLPPFSPLVCYEAIFPAAVTGPGPRPAWLLNVTNDAWFGHSAGPYQHLAQARLRAVEEGLPLVRAANTGISAVFDAYGRLVAELPIGRRGVIEARLPAALDGPTPFARLGQAAFGLLAVVALGLGVALGRRRGPRAKP